MVIMQKDEIDQITEALKTCDSPFELAGYLTKLAGWGSYYAEMMKKIQLRKPSRWLELKTVSQIDEGKREKDLSDKHTDILWQTTEDGQKEIALKYELNRIDSMMSSIKQRLYAEKVDFRGLNQQI